MSGRSEHEGAPPAAVALRYESGSDAAPRVTAKGRGELAERILAVARENGVEVREDRDLVELLSACELGDEIPVELWGVVAELLSWLYRLNGELAGEDARVTPEEPAWPAPRRAP